MLLGVVGALLVAEIVARIAAPDEVDAFFTPFEHDDSSFREDIKHPTELRTLAWYIPVATGVTGSAPVTINNLGFRDELDYPAEKPAGCYRVLGLGDSMTFGKGVTAEETYLAVVERRLKTRYPNRCVEILNAGQPNTNFWIQWLHYKLKWHELKPDLVLVGFFVYNDTQLQDAEEPYSQRWMELIDRNDWMKSSALVRWIYYTAFFNLGAKALDESLPEFYRYGYEGFEQFRDSVRNLKAFATGQNTKVAFVLIPIPEGYDDYPYLEYHELVTRFLVQEHSIPTFDLLPGLRGLNARKHWVHPSDAHPDAFVHEQMAQYMLEVMPWGAWIGGEP